jgi:hypothetical protein
MKKNLGESRSSQSVLAGGLLGLRGSPSYDKLVHDSSKSTELLARSELTVDKLIKIFDGSDAAAEAVKTASMDLSTLFLVNSLSQRQYMGFL